MRNAIILCRSIMDACVRDYRTGYPRQFSRSGFSIAHLCRPVGSVDTPCGQQCAANGSRWVSNDKSSDLWSGTANDHSRGIMSGSIYDVETGRQNFWTPISLVNCLRQESGRSFMRHDD